MTAYSETFKAAVTKVLKREGGYINHPDDRGGETNFGISARSHPEVDVKNLTREQAIDIYYHAYWQGEYRWLQELGPDKAMLIFDFAVNLPPAALGRCVQNALNACTHKVWVDGKVGPQTISALKVVHYQIFAAAFREALAGYYRLLAARNPSQQVFLKGWLNRAYNA